MNLPDLTPAELDALSAISLSDREAAVAAWMVDAPREAANLLKAMEDD